MIGILVVSHSDALARGVVEVAGQMAPDVAMIAAGGTDEGGVGTSMEKVLTGLEAADDGDGVLVLYDLGSAQMTAELALESAADPERVRLADAPLVEGALAAATAAAGGGTLDDVAAAATGAGPGATAGAAAAEEAVRETVTLTNPLGLHARPAAAVVRALADLEADVTVTAEGRTVSARSLLALVSLTADGGTEVTVAAGRPAAAPAGERVVALAAEGFGEAEEPTLAQRPEPPPAAAHPPGELRGAGASPGVALGPAARLRVAPVAVPDTPATDEAEERQTLDEARRLAAGELDRLAAGPQGEIFAAHRLVLEDPELNEAVDHRLRDGYNAARAWEEAVDELRQRVADLPGELFAARAVDVADVGRRVLRALLGTEERISLEPGTVVVTDDLAPSLVPALLEADAAGVALAGGSPTAHAAIVAHNLGLPMVVALGRGITDVAEGALLLLDGGTGTIKVDPPPDEQAAVRDRQETERERMVALAARAREPGRLADGTPITVAANVASVAEARAAVEHGAEGVGLLRTEFGFLDRPTLPSEDEQADALAAICAAMEGRPVIIRTLDVGGDKPVPALGLDAVHHGFLGERGLRYSLAHPALFQTQLRAILRVAVDHPVSVMFPMVTTVEEVRAAREALDRARSSLDRPGRLEEVGIMVEVPAAALAAQTFGADVDFFSIGSNDLVQYTMAADRTNPAVSALARPDHPAVLRLIGDLCAAADRAGRWVGVCGEAAADPDLAATLVGLGVRELSMAPTAIPDVKARLRRTAPDGGQVTEGT